jgi:hypothetical protein
LAAAAIDGRVLPAEGLERSGRWITLDTPF